MKTTKTKIKNLLITNIFKGSVETLSKLPYKVKDINDINDIHFLKMISLSNDDELPITKKVSFTLYRNYYFKKFLKVKIEVQVNCKNQTVSEKEMHDFIMNQIWCSPSDLHLYVNQMIELFGKYFLKKDANYIFKYKV